MPVQASFGDLAACAEKLPECTITILIRHLEPAISIFEIYSPFLYLRTLIRDSLLRVNRGYQQRVSKRHYQNDRQHVQYRALLSRRLIHSKNNMCRTKSINLDFVQLRWPDPEGPEGKVSRHTGCPATQ
ncbi:hypothetical protein T440DRAFT_27500 [Plenodomus tracheiphilus IPT5]|uniref:Uncharacterized protein n=1 Tax=Plenodomus tracheiphilus IPT5 TaxID=1408161 RepID=A0A6A7AMQ1_9PLEO|nr:hypothetical protein T440DRAFT_27500 [Plenodomus tracheiphilus IPT5]